MRAATELVYKMEVREGGGPEAKWRLVNAAGCRLGWRGENPNGYVGQHFGSQLKNWYQIHFQSILTQLNMLWLAFVTVLGSPLNGWESFLIQRNCTINKVRFAEGNVLVQKQNKSSHMVGGMFYKSMVKVGELSLQILLFVHIRSHYLQL